MIFCGVAPLRSHAGQVTNVFVYASGSNTSFGPDVDRADDKKGETSRSDCVRLRVFMVNCSDKVRQE